MNRFIQIGVVLAALCTSACATSPKILVGHNFAGPEKSVKVLVLYSGAQNKANDQQLYNVIVRMCDVSATAEAQCKDTTVLENVSPTPIH